MDVLQFIEWWCLILSQIAPYALVLALINRVVKMMLRAITGGKLRL